MQTTSQKYFLILVLVTACLRSAPISSVQSSLAMVQKPGQPQDDPKCVAHVEPTLCVQLNMCADIEKVVAEQQWRIDNCGTCERVNANAQAAIDACGRIPCLQIEELPLIQPEYGLGHIPHVQEEPIKIQPYNYLGCFHDNEGEWVGTDENNTVESCFGECKDSKFFILQHFGDKCLCMDELALGEDYPKIKNYHCADGLGGDMADAVYVVLHEEAVIEVINKDPFITHEDPVIEIVDQPAPVIEVVEEVVPVPVVVVEATPVKNCQAWEDQACNDENCRYWASIGECDANPDFMIPMCPVHCNQNAPVLADNQPQVVQETQQKQQVLSKHGGDEKDSTKNMPVKDDNTEPDQNKGVNEQLENNDGPNMMTTENVNEQPENNDGPNMMTTPENVNEQPENNDGPNMMTTPESDNTQQNNDNSNYGDQANMMTSNEETQQTQNTPTENNDEMQTDMPESQQNSQPQQSTQEQNVVNINQNPSFLPQNNDLNDLDEMEQATVQNEDHVLHEGQVHDEIDQWGYTEPQLVLGSLF